MTTGQAGRMMLMLLLTLVIVSGCANEAARREPGPQQQATKQQQRLQGAQHNRNNGEQQQQGNQAVPNDAVRRNPAPIPSPELQPEARPQQLGHIHPPDASEQQQKAYRSDDGMIRRPGPQAQQANPGSPITKPGSADSDSRPTVPAEVRGIYVSGWVAGGGKSMERMIQLVERTDLNAMVIDVKNDYGQLTYRSSLPDVKATGADTRPAIADMSALLKRLKEKQIYTIGRVVVFKDPHLAKSRSEWAFHTKDGSIWRDRKGKAWVDPFHPDVRAYNVAIAKEAAVLGFDEIQFDYVRFPDNGAEMDRKVRYYHAEMSKQEAIGQFLQDARAALHPMGTVVSADVFGLVTSSRDDMGIGQTWRRIAPVVDVISPMIYPSHYAPGTYGVRHPDLNPAAIVKRAVEDAESRNGYLEQEGGKTAVVRPWLQAFTARWVNPHQPYREAEIREQIEAAKSAGARQFLLWNPSCRYDYSSS